MQEQDKKALGEKIGVAVDLGSTTIAVCCLDMMTKKEILSFSFANPQRSHGADVITRIRYCMESHENLLEMGKIVREALASKLEEHLGNRIMAVSQIVYSGNTTMLHILRGLSVEGLSCSPFTPVTTDYANEKSTKTFVTNATNHTTDTKFLYDIEEIYPPCFSAFVGADILTGVYYLKMGQSPQYDLLVDLGTNGEILLINQDKGFAVSTACGPVFDSAITGARYGSECIHAIANCIKRGLIQQNGLIVAPFFEKGIEIDKGFIIKQQNIRNFQLAKAAIYAGIQCLLQKAKIDYSQINHVYISGGLGFYMAIKDAFTVKMLPRELAGKITISGNSSLEGAKELLLTDMKDKGTIINAYEVICKKTESFELSNFESFQEMFINALNF